MPSFLQNLAQEAVGFHGEMAVRAEVFFAESQGLLLKDSGAGGVAGAEHVFRGKNTMKTALNGTILALAALLPMAATAATVTPTSYSYIAGTPAGETGFTYNDPSLTKLTDTLTGTTNPTDGSWVGWEYTDPGGVATIKFNFASPMTITQVSLDFLRQDAANTQLPESVTIGGTNFPTTDFATDNTQGFVAYSGSWTGSSLTVALNHTSAHWIFVNEAQFQGSPAVGGAVPEPASGRRGKLKHALPKWSKAGENWSSDLGPLDAVVASHSSGFGG